MSSFQVTVFLLTLLLSSILTEGRLDTDRRIHCEMQDTEKSSSNKRTLSQMKLNVLTQTQKEPSICADHNTNVKAVLDKEDFQSKGNHTELLQRLCSAFHQHETALEDLANTQKELIVSAVHMTSIKAILDKVDCQGKGNNTEDLERKLWASHQDERSSEDLANINQNMLDLSSVLNVLRRLCAYKHQVEPVNLSRMAHRSEGTRGGDKQENFKRKYIYTLDEFLDLVRIALISY